MHVKRWLGLLMLGVAVMGLGIAYLLREAYLTYTFPGIAYYLTLQFIPRYVRAVLFICVACAAIGTGLAAKLYGLDVLAVYGAARDAVDRARSGGGPTLIECVHYRAAPHATADDPRAYIDLSRVEEARANECVGRFERLLLDALRGDQTLFTRGDEVEAAWRVVDSILRFTESTEFPPPRPYEAGTWGPREADELLARDGRAWRRL